MPIAPVAVIAYNRPEHLSKVLAALEGQGVKKLYVFSDGPKTDADVLAVEQCRSLVAGVVDRNKTVVVEREYNWGLAKSVIGAVDMVLLEHDRVVILEDDCVPGPCFMEFMELCLDKYEDVEQIMAVTGYTLPIPQSLRDDYPWDAYLLRRIGSWGWATWRRAWEHYERDLSTAYDEAVRRGIDLAQCGRDVQGYIEGQLTGHPRDIWTPGWLLALYLRNAYCVYPTTSHVRNIGHDGSGVNCGDTGKYDVALSTGLQARLPDLPIVSEAMLRNYRSVMG